jgi:hypothetical protein
MKNARANAFASSGWATRPFFSIAEERREKRRRGESEEQQRGRARTASAHRHSPPFVCCVLLPSLCVCGLTLRDLFGAVAAELELLALRVLKRQVRHHERGGGGGGRKRGRLEEGRRSEARLACWKCRAESARARRSATPHRVQSAIASRLAQLLNEIKSLKNRRDILILLCVCPRNSTSTSSLLRAPEREERSIFLKSSSTAFRIVLVAIPRFVCCGLLRVIVLHSGALPA